ncbi:uncharacterized protein BDV17DRAFT_296410 [Aspergillus undulatus]|uniref:uncharacterized protein n=1 Tax=Aspergillus undulatus TaxID=1810928 RepID=UPI003CCE1C98
MARRHVGDRRELFDPAAVTLDLAGQCEWLLHYELLPEDAEDVPEPATGNKIFESRWLLEEDNATRDKPKPEHFHRLFISLGYAARRMRCLKSINVFLWSGRGPSSSFMAAAPLPNNA